MQRFTWLFTIVILAFAAPLLTQAQPAVPNSSALDRAADLSQRELQWKPCPENASLECATLTLPVDYADPKGPTFEMAVIRAKASDPNKRIGTIFTHPGGHLSGVTFLAASGNIPAFQRIRERFDIVSLDPRGAGRTQPLDCGFDLLPVPSDQSDAARIAYYDEYGRRVAEQCLDQSRDFVLSISGNSFARDIEQFRRALGERQLSFLMISNSGPVGAIYASLYPRRVRAMLLDSPVGPDFHDYLIERPSEQGASSTVTLQRVDQLCRRIAGCPLKSIGVVTAFDTLAAKLAAEPFTAPDGTLFTRADLTATILRLLASEQSWQPMIGALTSALNGNFNSLLQFRPTPSTIDSSFTARLCNDYGTRRTAADYLPIVDAVGTTFERFGGADTLAPFAAQCSAWPAADQPIIRNVQRQLAVPVLLLGSEFDPAAPFPWTKRMATALGMDTSVVRYAGGGHVLSTRSDLPCVASIIDDYLFDLKLPAAGTVCPTPFSAP